MFVFNASFMMEHETEPQFLKWLKKIKSVVPADVPSRVSVMREAGGISHSEADAQTVSVQWEFGSMSEARDWSGKEFNEIMRECERDFGDKVMVFTSIFETL